MNKIYLISKTTNEVLSEYKNVVRWSSTFVEFLNGGVCKIYCDENKEYFTDQIEDEPVEEETQENIDEV